MEKFGGVAFRHCHLMARQEIQYFGAYEHPFRWTSIQMNIHLLAMLLFSGVPVFFARDIACWGSKHCKHSIPTRKEQLPSRFTMCHDVFLLRLDSKKSWPKPKHVICHNKHIKPDPRQETRSITSSPHARHTIIHYNLYKGLKPSSVFWFCAEALTRNEVHRVIVWGWKSPMTRWCISRTIQILAAWSTIFTHVPDGGILDVCRLVLAFDFSGLNSTSDSESPETGANFIY